MSSARYTMILLLPLLCMAATTETVACEPNRQDKKAKPCWIDQPDLLYGWLLDRKAFLSFERGNDLESWQASIAFLFQDYDSITTVNGSNTGIRENEAAALIGYFFSDPE